LSPASLVEAFRADPVRQPTTATSKIAASVLASVAAGLLLAALGGLANYFVMRAQLNTLERDLRAHIALEGHTPLVRRVDRLEGRLDAYRERTDEARGSIDTRLQSIETSVGQMRSALDAVLSSRPRRAIFEPPAGDLEKTIRYGNPANGDFDFNFFVPQSWTLTRLQTSMIGGILPQVTFEVRFGPDPSAAANGTAVVPGGTFTNNTTTGDSITVLTNPVIPADSHVWLRLLVVTTLTAQPDSFGVTLIGAL